jgi:hypothetical protein
MDGYGLLDRFPLTRIAMAGLDPGHDIEIVHIFVLLPMPLPTMKRGLLRPRAARHGELT